MQRTHTFVEDGTRYDADAILLAQGYLQVDTRQDFSGYGNWLHLDALKAVTFAEGDLYRITFDSPDEVRGWLSNIPELIHVDPGLHGLDHTRARALDLGIGDLFSPPFAPAGDAPATASAPTA